MRCSFIPPFLLQRLVSTAEDPRLSAGGERTLAVDRQFRASRQVTRSMVVPAPVATGATRVIHTAGHTEELPGTALRSDAEGGGGTDTGDVAVDEAWVSSGQVLDLFATVFDRRSVDGRGTPLSVTVHYGTNYDNAFWDGTQLVFGDGDGTIFDRFTKPFDVMAHEFTHGVTENTAALTYQGQPGALNESVSDVFASQSVQRVAGQTADQASWLIGEGIFLPGVQATALRSMKAPGTAYDDPRLGKDPQVGSMADYVETTDDNGGVHTNSGIPNRAFYLVAAAIGGHSWETPGAIWYDTLTGGTIGADGDFRTFAEATVASARKLFADDASIAEKVTGAWQQVGVLAAAAPTGDTPNTPPPTTPLPTPPQTLRVRRTGGVTGAVREATIDLSSHPNGPELQALLDRTDFEALASGGPTGPDRFVYSVQYGADRAVLGEHELGPDLRQLIQLVLDD
ncbi:MAG: protealysin inhibitor emfourin [Propionibacteriaceae bacterium]